MFKKYTLILFLLAFLFASSPADALTQKQQITQILNTQKGKEISRLVNIYSNQYKVNPKLIHAIIYVESGYNVTAKSSHGASGLMQLMPQTAKARGCYNSLNMQCNINAGTKHISGLLSKYKGDEIKALAAYNAGGGAVDKSLKKTGCIPKYTQAYVNKVLTIKKLYN